MREMKWKSYDKSRLIDVIIVLSAFFVYFFWALQLPVQQAPDEAMRFYVPKYIFATGSLPRGDDPRVIDDIWGFSYAFTPYGSSLLSVCFMKITYLFCQSGTALYIASRMTSVFSGAGTLIFCLKTGRLAFKKPITRWTYAILVGFLPQFVFLSSYLNNDSFAVFTSSAIFYYWLKGLKDGWNVRSCVGLGIWLGFCALSYYNAYGYILCSMVVFFYSVLRRENGKKENWKFLITRGGLIFAIAFAVAGWFFIRNFILYQGDFLGMDAMYACGELHGMEQYRFSNRMTFQRQSVSIFYMLLHTNWVSKTLFSFFAVFGYADIYIGKIFYIVYTGLTAVGVCMGMRAVFLAKKEKYNKLILANGLLAMLIPVVLSLYYSYACDYQAQGRYIMPGLPVIMFFLTIGVDRMERRFSKKFFKIYGITAVLWLALFSFIFVKCIVPQCMGGCYAP